MPTWKILKAEYVRVGEYDPEAPESWYLINLTQGTTGTIDQVQIQYSDVKILMYHYEVTTPKDLVNKTFKSKKAFPESALEILLLTIKNGGKYRPPKHKDIRSYAALALASLSEPDYSTVDKDSVYTAFAEVWNGEKAQEKWLKSFKQEIFDLSRGRVIVLDSSPKNFKKTTLGPANYLKLVKDSLITKHFTLGPYSRPIEFDR